MLEQVQHEFRVASAQLEAARVAATAYAGLLVSKGYLARKGSLVNESVDGRALVVSGIAAVPDALARARDDQKIASVLGELEIVCGTESTVRCSHAVNTQDDAYAGKPPWGSLRLECDCILCVSPLRTTGGELVGRCLLPLDEALADALWAWEIEYDSIYGCWLAGGSYESWAKEELVNPHSQLNSTADLLASSLSEALGCQVDYCPHQEGCYKD